MESWVLEGDSYSFLQSAQCNFNLRPRDRPDRVEIFDITAIPSSRSAISETTCLCDIFGDDCESPLSSSPASASFPKRDVDEHLPAEDVNDSSGSYHTAHGSEQLSDASDTFEEPKDAVSHKQAENSHLTDARELNSTSTLSDDKSTSACGNGSLTPNKVNDNDLPQTGDKQETHLSQDTTQEVLRTPAENTDSSDQQQVMSQSEFRHTNVGVNCSSLETDIPDLISENSISEESDTTSSELRQISSQPQQQESPFSEIQDHTVAVEPLEKSSLEVTTIEASPEKKNVEGCTEEKEENTHLPDIKSNRSSPAENILSNQETGEGNSSSDLISFSPEDSDFTPTQCCLSTPNPSVRSVTPEISSSPARMEIPSDSVILEARDTSVGPSPEPLRSPSTPQLDDTAELSEEPSPVPSPIPSPTPGALNSMEEHFFPPQSPTNSPETREEELSDQRRLSFSSGVSDRHSTPEVSEDYAFSDSLVTAHASEPSILVYSPVGYTISPSPECERKMYSPESEAVLTTPEVPELDCASRLTDFRDSVSSPDSRLCFTPESRSITSTPESRQNFLTPECVPTAPSPGLRSSSCSPEIKTITCSVLTENSKSPQINQITYRVVSPLNRVTPTSPGVDELNGDNISDTNPTNETANPAISPTSNLSSTPGCLSRPPSANLSIPRDVPSPKTRDRSSPEGLNAHQPVPEPYDLLKQADVELDHPSSLADGEQFEDAVYKESTKSPAMDNSKDIASEALSQINKDSASVPCSAKLSMIQTEESGEETNASLPGSIPCEKTDGLSPWHSSKTMVTAAITKEGSFLEGDDNCNGKELLEREPAGSKKPHGQMPVRLRESPTVFHNHNEREGDGQPCMAKGRIGERAVWEEHGSEKGVGNIAEGSYRGEQVELSFSTRNRKGPASHNPAPSSRDPKSGIPACCYFESPLTTRQQQNLLRAHSVQNKTGVRRTQSAFQGNQSGAGRFPSECTSETSSMGSEFDEADNEVKWFTNLAFSSLSSPQVDYLDVYNSSQRSSTNISHPSTVESPGTLTWMSYADLRGSTLHESDGLLGSSVLPHGTLDPARRFEMGSFECVDVALESKEESKRGKRTVPKRQILLKRRSNDESKSTENAENVMDSLTTQRHAQDSFVRQHSTPAAVPEDVFSGEPTFHGNRKALQKSASLDETSNKTKMASSIIKNVLSKKMDTVTKESSRSDSSSPSEDKMKHAETSSAGASSNVERPSLCSSLPSECSLSPEDFVGREQRSPFPQRRIGPKVPPKPFFRPSFLPTFSDPVVGAPQGKTTFTDQVNTRMDDSFEPKILPKKQIIKSTKREESCNVDERYSSDSAKPFARNTSPAATRASSTQNRMANRDVEHPERPETHKQRDGRRVFLAKTPQVPIKSCTLRDKKESYLNVIRPPDVEISKDPRCEPHLEETREAQMTFKSDTELENENGCEKHKPKPVMHKVRDVRKMVKNTYNLSFKASNNTLPTENPLTQEHKEVPPQNPHPLHIEYKAVSRKDKQASGNNVPTLQDETCAVDKPVSPQKDSEINLDITELSAKASMPNVVVESQPKTTNVTVHAEGAFTVPDDRNGISKSSDDFEPNAKLEMPPRPTSKEVSTVVFLQDGTSKGVHKPPSPAPPEVKPLSSSHSAVSMLLKEKGMQADIGVCDVANNNGARAIAKHVNRIEVPLQTSSNELQKMKKDEAALPCELKTSNDITLQPSQGASLDRSSARANEPKMGSSGTMTDTKSQAALSQPFKEPEKKMISHATSVTKMSAPPATSNKAEVRSLSSNTKSQAGPVSTSKEIELPIQVRSVSSDRPKPSLPPKPSYKQPFAEIRSISSDLPKTDIPPTTSIFKQQTHSNGDVKKNETPPTLVYKEQASETSSNTKKFAVSAVSSVVPAAPTSSSVEKSIASVATSRQQVTSMSSVQTPGNRQQQDINQEQITPVSTCASSHPVLPAVPQKHTYTQPAVSASSHTQLHAEDFFFHASDDPPSYEERESFSPLLLSDLPPRKLNRYQPTNKHSPCSCTTSSHPQLGHPYHDSQNQTPPAPQSPGHVLPYPGGAPPQAQVRPHQCRPEGQSLNYPPASPKATVPQAPAMIQPLLHACTAPVMQPYGDEPKPPSTQQTERRSSNHRLAQAPGHAAYRDHSRSPNRPALDPRSQFFSPPDLPPAFSHDYGSDGSGTGGMLYPDNASGLGYGQGPRRVLLDPETGKYFYIEVPMQPLRKMLFDPELGQYVEVLIPQQALSHSGMYPPTAAPYPSLHGAGLYAPQYLPYAVPPHPQSAQQPRHPDPSVPTSLHQSSMGYGNSASQMPKEAKGHPSLDQGYLEGMYYIPTGMNASPNSSTSDRYRKTSSNVPATAGRRA